MCSEQGNRNTATASSQTSLPRGSATGKCGDRDCFVWRWTEWGATRISTRLECKMRVYKIDCMSDTLIALAQTSDPFRCPLSHAISQIEHHGSVQWSPLMDRYWRGYGLEDISVNQLPDAKPLRALDQGFSARRPYYDLLPNKLHMDGVHSV